MVSDLFLFGVLFVVALFIAIWYYERYYWKIQKMFNSSILSLYTPTELFPISESVNKDEFDEINRVGNRYMKTQKCVIVTLVRDVEDVIVDMARKVEHLGSMFKDYAVLVVENDSRDSTREQLLAWATKNRRVTILGCGYNVKECKMNLAATIPRSISTGRIGKMVYLRNVYVREIKERYTDFDYVAMWDLDIIGSLYSDGVMNTFYYFSFQRDVDVICSFGIHVGKFVHVYYDTYAHLEKGKQFDLKSKMAHDIETGLLSMKYSRGDPPVEVESCFSGMTFYRASALTGPDVVYDMTPEDGTGNIECEHVRLHQKIRGKKMMNPSMINLVLRNN